MRRSAVPILAAALALPLAAAERQPSPPDVKVYIVWPRDGQVIKGGKSWLRMGASNVGIAPAGVEKANTGHFHVIVDADPPPGQPIPNNKNYLHFGGGQTETTLDLRPGRHTLQLLLGDAGHVPFDPPVMSRRITITVAQP